jgi:hypothetical protein
MQMNEFSHEALIPSGGVHLPAQFDQERIEIDDIVWTDTISGQTSTNGEFPVDIWNLSNCGSDKTRSLPIPSNPY